MAKRFTDTDKWKKKFIRSLQAPYKLLWLYILDECDHAGIWIVDFDVAVLRINEKVKEEIALNVFYEKIIPISDGEKWLILDFIEFQYGTLNVKNRVHESVINQLKKYDVWDFEENNIKKNKPLTSPLQGVKEKDKDKDKEKVKEEDKESEVLEIEIYPTFDDFWNEYDKKVGEKDKLKKKWDSIKQEERERIMAFIPNYKLSQPEKQYRKNPESFFNQKTWNDELVFKQDQKSKVDILIDQHTEMNLRNELRYGNQ